jgi:tricarballylate dehydrogenase
LQEWVDQAMAATRQTHDFDVIVVGSGVAGLSTAVAALQAGARVAVLERSPLEDRGGNSRWTEAMMRLKSPTEVTDDFESHFARNAGHHLDPELIKETSKDFASWPSIVKVLGFTDPELIATFASKAPEALAWLQDFGVRFDYLPNYFISRSTPRIAPLGGGLAIVEALSEWVDNNGATVFYQTTARRLIEDDNGQVVGLEAVGAGNRRITMNASAVVLACGGFEGNQEMQTRYLGPQARYLRPVARGGYYNKGEGIRMALDIGAAPCGDYGSFHAQPLDPRSGVPEPVILSFNYGVLVNTDGERFVDEAPTFIDAVYEEITRVIWQQPGGTAFAVHDAKINEIENWRRTIRSDQTEIKADTLSELAEKLEIDATAFERTIDAYNAACDADGAFDMMEPDGLAAHPADAPRKSNWARPIDTPLYLAFPVMCGNCFTFGGLKVNTNAQVLNADGEEIPGLYAAGEVIGLYYGTYTGATSVLRGCVFGRIAGAHAGERAVTKQDAAE